MAQLNDFHSVDEYQIHYGLPKDDPMVGIYKVMLQVSDHVSVMNETISKQTPTGLIDVNESIKEANKEVRDTTGYLRKITSELKVFSLRDRIFLILLGGVIAIMVSFFASLGKSKAISVGVSYEVKEDKERSIVTLSGKRPSAAHVDGNSVIVEYAK